VAICGSYVALAGTFRALGRVATPTYECLDLLAPGLNVAGKRGCDFSLRAGELCDHTLPFTISGCPAEVVYPASNHRSSVFSLRPLFLPPDQDGRLTISACSRQASRNGPCRSASFAVFVAGHVYPSLLVAPVLPAETAHYQDPGRGCTAFI